jgi:hypothetical protein
MTDNLLDDNEPVVDPNKDYLTELVGDGKKFKSEKELAKGKYEADLYIKTLERKFDQLREDYVKLDTDYKTREKLEELMDRINKPNQSSNEQPLVNDRDKRPSLDPEQIENIFSKKLQEYELSKKQTENLNAVKVRLKEQLGTNYQAALKQQIEDLGLTEDDVNALAKKSPAAFFKTLGLDQLPQQESFQPPPRSTQRNDSFKPKGADVRDWDYWQNVKKTDPKRYYTPETNIQMLKDYEDLGPKFETPDFKRL